MPGHSPGCSITRSSAPTPPGKRCGRPPKPPPGSAPRRSTVQPYYIRLAADQLRGSGVLVGTVVGFPHDNETPSTKEFQTKEVLDLGAEEIDMVMNIPALKNRDEAHFIRDIQGVVSVAGGRVVKVMIENILLTQEEKRPACDWVARSGARFVKNSTACAGGGATLEDVRLMYDAVAGRGLVKAAGGIREIGEVLSFLPAGARRFGSTRTDQFVRAFRALSEEDRCRSRRSSRRRVDPRRPAPISALDDRRLPDQWRRVTSDEPGRPRAPG